MKCISDCNLFIGTNSIEIRPYSPGADGYFTRRYEFTESGAMHMTQENLNGAITTHSRVRLADVMRNLSDFLDDD